MNWSGLCTHKHIGNLANSSHRTGKCSSQIHFRTDAHKFADAGKLRIEFGTWETMNNSTAHWSKMQPLCMHTMTAQQWTRLYYMHEICCIERGKQMNLIQWKLLFICVGCLPPSMVAVGCVGVQSVIYTKWSSEIRFHCENCLGFVLAFGSMLSPLPDFGSVVLCVCVQWTFHVKCDAVDENLHCVRFMWNAIYYLLNRMKQRKKNRTKQNKTEHNIVSNVEAKSCEACVSEWVSNVYAVRHASRYMRPEFIRIHAVNTDCSSCGR